MSEILSAQLDNVPTKGGLLVASNIFMWIVERIHTMNHTDMTFYLSSIVSILSGVWVILQIISWVKKEFKRKTK